jgi:hypothetical protein
MQRERALHHLKAIRREVSRLTSLEPSWVGLDSDDRIGYRAEWSNVVDRFSAVVRAYADDQLDHDVSSQVLDIARILLTFSPTLDRMQLRQPSADDLRRLGIPSAA